LKNETKDKEYLDVKFSLIFPFVGTDPPPGRDTKASMDYVDSTAIEAMTVTILDITHITHITIIKLIMDTADITAISRNAKVITVSVLLRIS
jgi:hypothetical protein